MKRIIGIDPGLSGGIAVCIFANKSIEEVVNMPETPRDILDYLGKWADTNDVVCYLEDVGHGIPNQSSKATATFAKHIGHLEMALLAKNIPFVKVTPQKWQKFYSNTLGKSTQFEKTEWKRKLKELAQSYYPNVKVTLKNADAILISRYGVYQENG